MSPRAVIWVLACMCSSAAAEEARPIRIGMSAALSGPAQSLGSGMRLGIEAYFESVNRNGGIHGRSLELIALDDGYEPESAARNMEYLIDHERVIAVIGNVGTPTAQLTVPIANEKKTLLFGAFTGAGLLRSPASRYVVNYRASYAQETKAMVELLLEQGTLPYRIAVFSQNDAYGDAGYQGVVEGLAASGYTDGARLPHGRYERNTADVTEGLLTILESSEKPQAIIMIGTYSACAKFIRGARAALPDTRFLNVSFVGSMALKDALGADGDGVVVTQVVPHFEAELPIIDSYMRHLKMLDAHAEPGFVSLEGYIVARIFVEGLRRAGPAVDRESIIDALLSIQDLDIGIGSFIDYRDKPYQGSQTVWPTVIRDGHFVGIDPDGL